MVLCYINLHSHTAQVLPSTNATQYRQVLLNTQYPSTGIIRTLVWSLISYSSAMLT